MARLLTTSAAIRRFFGSTVVLWVSLVISTMMFGVLVPAGSRAVTADGVRGARLLDEEVPTWSAAGAEALLAGLGPDGREAYQDFYLRLDFWFPVLSLSVFFAAALSLLYPVSSRLGWVNLLPLPLWLLDVAENVNHFTMAAAFPERFELSYQLGPLFTLAKWLVMAACIVLLVVGLVRRLAVRRARGRGILQ